MVSIRRNKRDRQDPEAAESEEDVISHANYHSFSDSAAVPDPLAGGAAAADAAGTSPSWAPKPDEIQYRGFQSSVSDLFADESRERVDCCAVTCCGILQNDRDRFLVTGVTPPTPAKRCVMHAMLPFCLFFFAGMAALHIRDRVLNQIVATGLILMLAFYFGLQCSKGRWKRMEIRKDLLYTKYQVLRAAGNDNAETDVEHLAHRNEDDDDNGDDDPNSSRDYYQGQSRRDFGQAHPCCLVGCYAEDRPLPLRGDVASPRDNLARCLYETACPCASVSNCCGMQLQLCGVCAIAQEGRDVEAVTLPRNYTRIDYITMEHVSHYYPAIYRHRYYKDNNTGGDGDSDADGDAVVTGSGAEEEGAAASTSNATRHHHQHRWTVLGHPLSKLSYQLLQSLLWFWFCMLLWCFFGPFYWRYIAGQRGNPHMFRLVNFVLLVLTFAQAVLFLWLWTYILSRYYSNQQQQQSSSSSPKTPRIELSMDARIKYFASGFFLSASLALFWECVVALVVDTFITLLLAAAGVDVMDSPETDGSSSQAAEAAWLGSDLVPNAVTSSHKSPLLAQHFVSLLSGYWNDNDVSNWDANVTGRPNYAQVFGLDHPIFYTIYLLLATFVVAAFIEELCKYYGYRMVEHPDFYSRTEIEEATSGLEHHRHIEDEDDEEQVNEAPMANAAAHLDFSKQGESLQNRGASITLAMVSTAIGFACCENLMYIFFYSGQSFNLQLGVLIERSFFPIHPILAAIQSIGVCRRELEKAPTSKLGRIIFPAVCFHGTFDFLIVFISFVGKLVGQYYEEGDLRVSNTAEFLSVLACVWVMCGAIFYLYNESSKQRERLVAIDRQTSVDRSSLI